MNNRHTIENALRRTAESVDRDYGVLFEHGSMELGFYRPDGVDPQTPHTQDEIYIVHRGTGVFCVDGERQPFEQGEALFVAAGVEHRFEDFSEDFCAWVVFYGPDGGEST
jgi:mannose-6-phosphate isomerase-like protein (cupin superfamily)